MNLWLLVAAGSALLFGLAGLGMKISQARGGALPLLLLGLYVSGAAGFGVHTLLTGGVPWQDWRLWAASVVIGAGSAWGNLVFMKALDYGPASLTSPLANANIALVVLVSALYYGEPLTRGEIVAVCLLLAAVLLVSIRPRESLSVSDKRWFMYVGAAMLLFTFRNGGLKTTEELGLPNTPILFVGYALSALWFVPPALRALRDAPGGMRAPAAATGWRWGLASGVCSYAGLQLYAAALATGKASVAAPIFATNSLVVALGAIVLFRERLTAPQTVALVCTLVGLIALRVFRT